MTDYDETVPNGRCWLCWQRDPHQGGREADIIDARTGRYYCHEDALALFSWELDGLPEMTEHPDLTAALGYLPMTSSGEDG